MAEANRISNTEALASEPTSRDVADEPLVPEQPQLAPDVEIVGQMEGTGFTDQQWLIQKDGRFIQLTELLYRIAENIDGERSLGEIAREVSDATGRKVSSDNVRYLILKKLIPIGVVADAEGHIALSRKPRSPLQVNMRMIRVGPRYIEGPARVLRHLFHPPVLISILAIAAIAHSWVFFSRGVAGAIHQALYTPGLLLMVLGLIFLSGIFHEFGHAAALSYGGGKVRGMGAGLYLIFPAFYTDVTDAYRLGRWARVRVDLGGFYFNLIFSLGIMGLYAITGQEFLLLVVLFISLDILRQMLPFIRLDGYWTFADLTGIPDLFSQVGPYLRSVLPIPGWKGPRLPNLHTWVKVAFGAYIAITVPILLTLLFLMVRGIPRIMATGWESAQVHISIFLAARHKSDVLQMLASAVQLLLLAVPTFGVFFIIYKVGGKVFAGLWAWSGPSVPRRAGVSAMGFACLALVVFLWMPQIPPDHGTSSARDPRAYFQPIEPEESGTAADALHAMRLSELKKFPLIVPKPSSGGNNPTFSVGDQTPGDGEGSFLAEEADAEPDSIPTPQETPTPTRDASESQTSAEEATTPESAPATAPSATEPPTPAPSPTEEPTAQPTPEPSPTSEPSPTPKPTTTPEPTPEPTATPEPTPEPSPTPAPTPEPEPTPAQEPTQEPESEPTPAKEPTPTPAQEPTPEPEPTPAQEPTPSSE